MIRLGFRHVLEVVVGAALLSSGLGCQMANPAFDLRETDGQADGTEAAEGQDTKSELGDGDGDPDTGDGDGDGDPDTGDGDGDGDPDTGDGDGDPTTGDGDGDTSESESTTGDGDPIFLDMMVMDICPEIEGQDFCQQCAAEHCCLPGAGTCFQNGTDCRCMLDCMAEQQGDVMQCAAFCEAEEANIALVMQFAPCMDFNCNNFCN